MKRTTTDRIRLAVGLLIFAAALIHWGAAGIMFGGIAAIAVSPKGYYL